MKLLSILIFTIVIALTNSSNKKYRELNKKVYGTWEYDKVKMDGIWMDAIESNPCAYRAIVEISNKYHLSTSDYEVEGEKFKSFKIGELDRKVCGIDVETAEPKVFNNSCYNNLMSLLSHKNSLLIEGEGIWLMYKIEKLTRKSMTLSKIRDFIGDASYYPDKIKLKKI